MESIVTGLALLACPLGMGAMMWFMMRGMKQPLSGSDQGDEVTALRAEQIRLEADVERLRAEDAVGEAATVATGR